MAAFRISCAQLPISYGYSATSPRNLSAYIRVASDQDAGGMRCEPAPAAQPEAAQDKKNRKNEPKTENFWRVPFQMLQV